MSATAYNLTLAIGWLLVLFGGMLIHPGAGLVGSGLLLILLALLNVRLAGLYLPPGHATAATAPAGGQA